MAHPNRSDLFNLIRSYQSYLDAGQLPSLPTVLLQTIFSFLSEPEKVRGVCRTWNQIKLFCDEESVKLEKKLEILVFKGETFEYPFVREGLIRNIYSGITTGLFEDTYPVSSSTWIGETHMTSVWHGRHMVVSKDWLLVLQEGPLSTRRFHTWRFCFGAWQRKPDLDLPYTDLWGFQSNSIFYFVCRMKGRSQTHICYIDLENQLADRRFFDVHIECDNWTQTRWKRRGFYYADISGSIGVIQKKRNNHPIYNKS